MKHLPQIPLQETFFRLQDLALHSISLIFLRATPAVFCRSVRARFSRIFGPAPLSPSGKKRRRRNTAPHAENVTRPGASKSRCAFSCHRFSSLREVAERGPVRFRGQVCLYCIWVGKKENRLYTVTSGCKNYVLTKESFPSVLPTFALCGVREKEGHDMAGVPPVTAHTYGKIISNT